MGNTARAPKKSSTNQKGNTAATPKAKRLSFSERWERERSNKAQKKYNCALKTAYESMKENVFGLVSRDEVERLARDHKFALCKEESKIPPFEFVLCCALSAVAEQSRGFASVWRILAAACGIKVARSAPIQRFGKASAELMQAVFERAVSRLPLPVQEEVTNKLSMFEQVLADDGSVLKLSPLLEKLFPATRTNTMKAAAKLHARADLVNRRIVRVEITGERESELEVARRDPVQPGTLHMSDLAYTAYGYFADIAEGGADLLFRLKSSANPTVEWVRHGVQAPRRSEGKKLSEMEFCRTYDTFDLDASFPYEEADGTKRSVLLRVVGVFNHETEVYHCYVTTLSEEQFSPEEIANLYCLRWVIELLFKLLKSSCHLDHLNTSKPHAIRTFIYASLLMSTILSAMAMTAARHAGISPNDISVLMLGIAAPLMAIPLMLLWQDRELTREEMAAMLMDIILNCCRQQNHKRARKKWGNVL